MSKIPTEYLLPRSREDFGFSAVDETELTPIVTNETFESVSASVEDMSRIESKMDTILQLYNEGKLGLDDERIRLHEETSGKLKRLEELIMPLLVNLMKNPEKEYIFWPGRTEKIQEQIDKILSLTRD